MFGGVINWDNGDLVFFFKRWDQIVKRRKKTHWNSGGKCGSLASKQGEDKTNLKWKWNDGWEN